MSAACARCGFDPDATITEPVLGCSSCGRPTQHGFEGRKPALWRPPRGYPGDPAPAIALMFACRTCGTVRKWGMEAARAGAPSPGHGRLLWTGRGVS